MTPQRDIRRLAMQLLYQLDLRGEADGEAIAQSIDEEHDPQPVRAAAWPLAQAAWATRQGADTLATELAPDWPTHRQPPLDRAILRLAHHEMITGRTPVKVAINEAVELAKHYSTDQSAAFVNGVLDKMAKRLAEEDALPATAQAAPASDEKPDSDLWLSDALAEDNAQTTPDSD